MAIQRKVLVVMRFDADTGPFDIDGTSGVEEIGE